MPQGQFWSIALFLSWIVVATLRITIGLAKRLSVMPLSHDGLRLFGALERVLLLTTTSYALWYGSPRVYAEGYMAWAYAQDSRDSIHSLGLYSSAASLAAMCSYWGIALLSNFPGIPMRFNRKLFWPVQAFAVLIFLPSLFLADLSFLYYTAPLAVLWWLVIHDQSDNAAT